MKKVIVTGGAGFIGSNLVDNLINSGVEVIILDDLSTGKSDNINPKATFLRIDISDMRPGSTLFKIALDNAAGVDYIFHTAAKARVQPSIEDPVSFNKANVDGTLNMLCLAKELKVKRFIYSASSSAYGNATKFPTQEDHPTNPLSPYGLQKYIGEQYCKVFSEVYGLDTVSLRYFNVYGERMLLEGAYCLVLGIFAKQMLEGKPLTITNDGNQRRDFTYVGDIVQANILAATHEDKLNGEVFNIGRGTSYSINQIADMFGGEKEYGKKVIEPFETLAQTLKARSRFGWKPQGQVTDWIKKYKEELGL
jgi:nucleoside-diphosphate-sugar epimerase